MKNTIDKLISAHEHLMEVEVKGQNAVNLAEGLVRLTQAINELIAKDRESEVTEDGNDVLESSSSESN